MIRNVAILLLAVLMACAISMSVASFLTHRYDPGLPLTTSEFVSMIQKSPPGKPRIGELSWEGSVVHGQFESGESFTVSVPDIDSAGANEIIRLLNKHEIRWSRQDPSWTDTVHKATSFAGIGYGLLAALAFGVIRFLSRQKCAQSAASYYITTRLTLHFPENYRFVFPDGSRTSSPVTLEVVGGTTTYTFDDDGILFAAVVHTDPVAQASVHLSPSDLVPICKANPTQP